jgi:hypothetical protein
MSQYIFGTGQLFATPEGGGAPLRFGALQDVSVDFSGDNKQLFGQYQFALDTARGKTKIDWKASSGNVDVAAYNQIFFGGDVAVGDELAQIINEEAPVPATPFKVIVDNAAGFYQDLGVYNANTGLPLKQVASGPATGQYSVNPSTGEYTFAAADTTIPMLFNYLYETGDSGASLEISNQLMGTTPTFQLILSQVYKQKTFTLILYSCIADKLSLPLKQDDYLISDMSGTAQANAANRIGRMTTTSLGGGGS